MSPVREAVLRSPRASGIARYNPQTSAGRFACGKNAADGINELAFPVLSDVRNKVARQFGIVFELSGDLLKLYRQFGHALEEFNGESGRRELPVPGTFLADIGGTIRLPTLISE